MPTVEDFLHSRWHRIRERVIVLSCLKALSKDQPRGSDRLKRKRLDGDEVVALQGTAAYMFIPPLCEFFSGEVASITTSSFPSCAGSWGLLLLPLPLLRFRRVKPPCEVVSPVVIAVTSQLRSGMMWLFISFLETGIDLEVLRSM